MPDDTVPTANPLSDNLYERLGVSADASKRDITLAYRREALRWHPDKHSTDDAATQAAAAENFTRVAAANEVLIDPEKRAAYDRTLRESAAVAPTSTSAASTTTVSKATTASTTAPSPNPGAATPPETMQSQTVDPAAQPAGKKPAKEAKKAPAPSESQKPSSKSDDGPGGNDWRSIMTSMVTNMTNDFFQDFGETWGKKSTEKDAPAPKEVANEGAVEEAENDETAANTEASDKKSSLLLEDGPAVPMTPPADTATLDAAPQAMITAGPSYDATVDATTPPPRPSAGPEAPQMDEDDSHKLGR
jgi:curved DNA-binding protein CbpA